MYWDRFELDNLKSMPFTDSEIEKCTVRKGDLLVCEGGDIGRAAIWDCDEDIRIQNHIHRLRPYDKINCKFYYYILYLYKLNGKINGNGIGLQGLSSNALHSIITPLPPINEQIKIIAKLELIFSLITDVEINKTDLTMISTIIKSKILDIAIRGKLVPQNQDDEPASVLLERIKAEKEELIKQGKIKRDKKESVIFKGDDNSYYRSTSGNVELFADFTFELPDGWEWCNLSMISQIITKGTTPRGGNVAYVDKGIGFLRAENVSGFGKLDTTDLKYVTKDAHNNFLKRSILCANDILITIAGTLGRTAIVPETELPLNTNQAVSIVRPINYKLLNLMYVIYAVNASEISKKLLSQSVEMAIPNLSLDNISNCTFPLPPLAEQKRIVDAIETAFEHLDNILNNL